MRPHIRKAYILALHAALVVAILSSSLPGKLLRKVFPNDNGLPSHPFYSEMLTIQARMEPLIPADRVLFLGDSLIQSLCVNAITRDGINLGIGGETVRGLFQRIDQIKALHHARGVFILVGHNDLARNNPVSFKTDYSLLLDSIPSHIPVAACAILPIDESMVTYATNARIKDWNSTIEDLCANRYGCTFIPQPHELKDHDGNLGDTFHDDGVHLNASGYLLLIEAMQRATFLH